MNAERLEITPEYLAAQGLSATFPERFWKRVFITPTHWLWDGERRMPQGHGTLWRGVRNPRTGKWQWLIYAHVASWILNRGPIPEGKFVLHKCPGRHVPWCVNPEHLSLGTALENTQDTILQGKLHFHKGHKHNGIGENNASAKLTQEQVDSLRLRYGLGGVSQTQLARELGVTQACIWNILHGVSWKG